MGYPHKGQEEQEAQATALEEAKGELNGRVEGLNKRMQIAGEKQEDLNGFDRPNLDNLKARQTPSIYTITMR